MVISFCFQSPATYLIKQSCWRAAADEGMLDLTTKVAGVDLPLLSVAQMVYNGSKVVFSKGDRYIEYSNGRRDKLEQRDGLYIMKVWVPRNQKAPFQGQA